MSRGIPGSGWSFSAKGVALCRSCKKAVGCLPLKDCSIGHKNWYKRHQSIVAEAGRRLRKEVLLNYGGKCACCGFDNLDFTVYSQGFLQIDHIWGGGRKHILQIHRIGSNFYTWLKKNLFPSGYRVLCKSCNVSMLPGEPICEYHKWDWNSRKVEVPIQI